MMKKNLKHRKNTFCLLRDTIHNALDSIAGIVKRNIFCIVKITLILFPKAPELNQKFLQKALL